MRRLSASVLLFAALGASTRAAAQEADAVVAEEPARPAITLTVPEGCPDRAALETEIASLLGRPFDEIPIPDAGWTTLSISEDAGRYVLVVTSATGERTLRDPSCPALVRAAALIVALQIDADAATLAAASAAEAAQIAEEPAEPEPPAPEPGRRQRVWRFILDRSSRLGDPTTPFRLPALALGVGVALDAGLVPSVAGSFFVDAVVRIDRLELRGRLAYTVEQGQLRTIGVRASAVTATLLACGRPFDATLGLAFCGGIEGGDLLARSVGITNVMASDGGFLSAVIGVWLPLFPWTGIDVSLGAEGWARLSTPLFVIDSRDGPRTLYAPDPYGGRFAIAIHWNP